MGECDDVVRLLDTLCKGEYPDLPPEFVPIAKKYGYHIAKRVYYEVMVSIGKIDITKLMMVEYNNSNSPFRKYVDKMANETGLSPEEIIESKPAIEYFKWLKGLRT